MYRVACIFDPRIPTFRGRGAWRVTKCWKIDLPAWFVPNPFVREGVELVMGSTKPAIPGSYCNPFGMLKHFLEERKKR